MLNVTCGDCGLRSSAFQTFRPTSRVLGKPMGDNESKSRFDLVGRCFATMKRAIMTLSIHGAYINTTDPLINNGRRSGHLQEANLPS